MIEAVNSVLQSAPVIRVHAESVSTAESFAANPARVQKAAQAPYISPYYAADASSGKITMQIRDPSSGRVLESYPSDTTLQITTQTETQTARATVSAEESPAIVIQASSAAPAPAPQKAPAPSGKQIAAFVHAAQSGQQGSGGGGVSLVA